MRLIDAGELIKAFEALKLMSGEYADSFTNMAGNRSMEIERAEDYIDDAKTIDAVPVVHAHWIKNNCYNVRGLIYECSNCNTVMFSAWNYCPNCGADMRGEQDE